MSGPVPASASVPRIPHIPAVAAGRLAYYDAAGLAILAPRGWHCQEIYGSDGAILLVTPRAYTPHTLPEIAGLAGPVVELSLLNGENSGRDDVARVFSRLFPSKCRFIRDAAGNHDDPPHYPTGPYRTDVTVRHGRAEVDYTTPPHRNGMGTLASRLRPGASPIVGMAMLARSNGVDSVVLLNVRLPPRSHALANIILVAARRDHGGRSR